MNAVTHVCGAFLAVALACGTAPALAAAEPDSARAAADGDGARAAADSRPEPLRDVGIDQHLDAPLPLDLTFRDEQGASVRLGQYFGDKPVIVTLVYYECPMLCTLVLNGLVRAMNALAFDAGKEFEVVTVSFNPADTPALAAAKKESYLRSYPRPGAAAGWHFLTGDQAAIDALTRALGFRYRWVPEQRQYAHAAGIVVATPQGRLARYFYGLEYSARDLRLGLVEASQGKIGSPVDTVLLYCFAYDPVSGTYAATALNAIRIGGVVTVLALGGFLVTSVRRERRSEGR
jgi:protein SCO1/2